MQGKTKKSPVNDFTYSFNRGITPFPEQSEKKLTPPASSSNTFNNSSLFTKKELTKQEIIQQAFDSYSKTVRVVVNNFYTGGSAYKKGFLDSIYKGFVPGKIPQKA